MKTFHKTFRKLRRAISRDEPGYYDMYENPGERFFAKLYLDQIQRVLDSQGCASSLKVLDAGCQAGRLAVPLAQGGHRVTGVDTSGVALRRAKRHAQQVGVSLRLIRRDLGSWLPVQTEGSFDVVICTEVLYLRENHSTLLQGLIRLIRPRGLCFVSHRPPGYYLAEAFQRRDWGAVKLLLSCQDGILWGSYYNWQTQEELKALYPSLGVEILDMTPIGLLSWLAVKPDELNPKGQELLHQAELSLKDQHPGVARYLLVSGRKESRCQTPC